MTKIVTGVLAVANEPNANGRIYSEKCFQSMVKQFGELKHPCRGELDPIDNIVSLIKTSHVVHDVTIPKYRLPRKKKKLYKKLGKYEDWKKQNKKLVGTVEIFDTPQGEIAQEFLKCASFVPRMINEKVIDGKIVDAEILSYDIMPKSPSSKDNVLLKITLENGKNDTN